MKEQMMAALRPVTESKENKLAFNQIKGDWVTDIWYEKLALIVCIFWTVFSIGKFFWEMLR